LVSREYLDEYFNYDPITGVLSVKKPRKSAAGKFRNPGTPVGTLTEHGYLKISIKGKVQYVHRLAFLMMTGKMPEMVDHMNGNRADNRWANLRICTQQQNLRNLTKFKSLTGFKGVSKVGNRFRAQIHHENKQNHIGYYNTAKEAHEAYFQRAVELNGEFASRGVTHV